MVTETYQMTCTNPMQMFTQNEMLHLLSAWNANCDKCQCYVLTFHRKRPLYGERRQPYETGRPKTLNEFKSNLRVCLCLYSRTCSRLCLGLMRRVAGNISAPAWKSSLINELALQSCRAITHVNSWFVSDCEEFRGERLGQRYIKTRLAFCHLLFVINGLNTAMIVRMQLRVEHPAVFFTPNPLSDLRKRKEKNYFNTSLETQRSDPCRSIQVMISLLTFERLAGEKIK